MRRKIWGITGLLGMSVAAAVFSGRAETVKAAGDSEKETVSVALWSDQLMENYAPWLQEQFPEVEFVFYSATNSTDYYNYLAEKGELPDIMTVRRFSLKDVEELRDDLMDLSGSELALSYYQSYLSSYTYDDGTVNWLPACAEIDDIIVNKTLFEENGIELPTDYESFTAAVEAFDELGITGFVTDVKFDYACMETLQGFSADVLSTAEGRQWRQEYESGETNQLSEEVWLPVFEKMLDVIDLCGWDEETLELTSIPIGNAFGEGQIAMFRGGAAYMEAYGDQYEKLILPYPAENEEENYYLTYPVFQAAAKKPDDSERETLILEILDAMLSEEGLNHIIPGESMVAYRKNVEMTLDDSISNLEPYIAENRMYIRLASADMFSVSLTVVNEMITGEITTAQEALEEFNQILVENETAAEQPVAAHVDTGYTREFTAEHGNQAASAIFNTMREELGVDCLIGQSACIGTDLYEGDYTEKALDYLINWESSDVRQMELTGARLKEYLEFYLTAKETRDTVVNDSTLPVVSGFEITVSKTDDGYHLEKLTVNGEEIDEEQTYTVVSWDGYYSNEGDMLENAGFGEYELLDVNLETLVHQRLVEEGSQLEEPTDYIMIQA